MTSLQSEDMQPTAKHENKAGQALAWLALFKHADWIFAATICLLILFFFYKTGFAGASISRLCVLAEWDSVFDAWRTGRPQAYDPSLVQIFLPDYVFLAKNLCRGILPLWNPHCGLGYPFVGDIQSSVFAPLRCIFDFVPSLRSYNLFLIAEILVCGVSSYFLGRALTQPAGSQAPGAEDYDLETLTSRLASLFAAICYTFCPYNLWYLELNLGSSAALFPLTTLAFVRAAQRRTLGSAILAGIVSGILILSGHPECSFFGISLASLLMLLLLLLSPGRPLLARILSALKLLGVTAVGTVAVAAPALFPFAEYLLNAESYKYGSAYSTPVTWNGILFNLCNPGQNGASPYLSTIAMIALPLSLFGLRKSGKNIQATQALLISTLFCFLLVSQLGPIQAIFSKAPFTAIITRYALPFLLLLQSLLSALGLFQLAQLCRKQEAIGLSEKESARASSRIALLLILALVLTPALMFTWSASLAANQAWLKLADFDAMLPSTAFNPAAWRRDIICTSIFSLAALICYFVSSNSARLGLKNERMLGHFGTRILTAALVLGFVSLASVSKLSLPLQSQFFYPQTDLIGKLQNSQSRCISSCEYVLRPATNAVYGINFLCVHNPLYPRRFLNFLKACGARTDLFNQKFDTKLSTLLNLASVKHVLAVEPITDAAGKTNERFQLLYQSSNGIKVYENRDAAPRAYLVHKAIMSQGPEDSLSKIQSTDFDAKSAVVIESSKNESSHSSKSKAAGNTGKSASSAQGFEAVKILQIPDTNTVKISSQSQEQSWLVLTDIYYPGWQAYIDGRKAPIERANYAFRAIKLEPGNHEILFSYEPFCYYLGTGVFVMFVLLSVLAISSGTYKREL